MNIKKKKNNTITNWKSSPCFYMTKKNTSIITIINHH